MTEFRQLVETLKPFVKEVSRKSADKALLDLSRDLATALTESGISKDAYIEAYRKDKIFDPACLLGNHADLFEFVNPKFLDLCKIMFEQRPVGLGTPNAMVGEGEFMALFTSPRVGISKEKNKGDITVDGKTIELKGSQLRFFSPMKTTGKQVQEHAGKIAKKYGVTPNSAPGNRTAYEPWDNGRSKKWNKAAHWIEQFDNLGVEKSKEYLADLCSSFMECCAEDFNICFSKKKFDAYALQLLIVSKFFKGMEKKWDAFTQINEGKITCITDDLKAFDKLIKSGTLKMDGNYFRSFQDNVVGLYVKLC